MCFMTAVNMPEQTGDDIAAMEGVLEVDRVNWFPVQVEGATALLIAVARMGRLSSFSRESR